MNKLVIILSLCTMAQFANAGKDDPKYRLAKENLDADYPKQMQITCRKMHIDQAEKLDKLLSKLKSRGLKSIDGDAQFNLFARLWMADRQRGNCINSFFLGLPPMEDVIKKYFPNDIK